MIKADKKHKRRVIDILSECLDNNKTVNWIVKQDSKRKERIRHLMDYSFETCRNAGQVFLTDDLNGVIVYSLSDDKLPILEEAYFTLQFVFKVTGIGGIAKTLRREQYVNSFHPQDEEFIYIWFIGLEKTQQGKGLGSLMMREVINKSDKEQIPVYLETSNELNVKFYKKHGFEIYHVPDEDMFGYKLYFLRKLPNAV